MRIIKKNLIYVIGLAPEISDDQVSKIISKPIDFKNRLIFRIIRKN